MQLFSCFEPLLQYVATHKSQDFSQVDFATFNGSVTHLIDALNKKAESINSEQLRLAKLAVFSWVDETVQRSTWQYKAQWQQQLLQERYLSTANAGEAFFSVLANLSEKDAALIRIYYRCLILGFRGKYYRPEDSVEIRKIEQDCLFLMNIPIAKSADEHEKNFPQLYASTLAGTTIAKENGVRRWYYNKFILWGLPILLLLFIYFFFYGILHFTINNYLALLA